MKKQVKKLLGAVGVSLAAMSIGPPAYANNLTCNPNSALEIFSDCYGGVVSASGTTFTDVTIGDITLGLMADVIGAFAVTDNLSLTSASFTSGGTTLKSDLSPTGFSFDDVASGTYTVSLSGMLSGIQNPLNSQFSGLFLGGFRVIPQIPEPETYALLLAGLLTIGFVARRRSQG